MIPLPVPRHLTVNSTTSQESNPSGKHSTATYTPFASLTHPTSTGSRRLLLSSTSVVGLSVLFSFPAPSLSSSSSELITEFYELANSGGVRALDLRVGTGSTPVDGDQVAIHYYGRLAAKQGWRFDSTYDHKDFTGESIPFVFILGSGKVIAGIEAAVRTMRVGGIRRVIIPPSQGYQNTTQEPLPPNATTIYYHLQPDASGKWGRFHIRHLDI